MKRDYFPLIPLLFFIAFMMLLGNSIYMTGMVNTQPQFAGTTPLDLFDYIFLNLVEIPVVLAIFYTMYKIKKENKSKK
ncbi:MAG: hypothetical protein ACTSRP_10315 [Candidatus Helarchaeota archaeon]